MWGTTRNSAGLFCSMGRRVDTFLYLIMENDLDFHVTNSIPPTRCTEVFH